MDRSQLARFKPKQQGFVLLTTLVLILLLALLTLSQMQLLLLNYKSLNLVREKHQFFWALEEAAKRVEDSDLSRQDHCLLKEQDANLVVDLLKNKKACVLTYKKQLFYYLIEDLGLDPCWRIQLNKQSYSRQRIRISIGSFEKRAAILQLGIAKLARLAVCEDQEIKQARLGILSWRYLF